MKSLSRRLVTSLIFVASVFFGSALGAAQGDAKQQPMTREAQAKMHDDMAQTHEDMAACLKSNKTEKECRADMMKNCPMMKAGKSCPMMGMMEGHDMSNMKGMNMQNSGNKGKTK